MNPSSSLRAMGPPRRGRGARLLRGAARCVPPIGGIAGPLAALWAALWAGPAPVAADAALHLSLDECLDLALEQSSRLVQQQYTTQVADLQVTSARNTFLPSANASYGYSGQRSGPREGAYVDPATGLLVTGLSESKTSSSQSVGANVSMTLYDRGAWGRLAASKEGRRAAEMDQRQARLQVALEVKRGYFALLQAAELLEVQGEQVRLLEETLRRAEALHEMRSAPVSDVLSARANLASARAGLIQRENSVEVARADLALTLGLEAGHRLVAAQTDFAVEPVGLTAAAAVERALATHPELVSQKHSILQAREEIDATRYGVLHPSVRASASYNWRVASDEDFGGVEDLILKNYGLGFGVSASLPLFDRRGTSTSLKIQQLNYRRSLEAYEQARREASAAVTQALSTLAQLGRSIEANGIAVRASEESFRLAQERYDVGTGTFLERLQAQTSLFEARSSLVRATYDYHIQLAVLEEAVGGNLQPGGE